MLDVSRHFFDKAAVKDLLDDMFRLKLNVFHWHLSDDQGWRIEIKKYPKLTEIGSKRSFTQVGGWGSSKTEDIPHGGYYTQEDIKEIVEYAARRCISIVPEIDVPAHFAAALAAYPHLACRNIQSRVFGEMGGRLFTLKGIRDWNRPACLGKKKACNLYLMFMMRFAGFSRLNIFMWAAMKPMFPNGKNARIAKKQ